jgi:RNA polymerase sigma-70 factor (ECF subfamily)
VSSILKRKGRKNSAGAQKRRTILAKALGEVSVSISSDACNQLMEEFRAYLETLTYVQIDPRLRNHISLSDMIQNTLVEAWHDLKRIESLDADGRKRKLRKMLVNNLIDEIRRMRPKIGQTQSLDAALEESSCRLIDWQASEDTPPVEGLIRQEEGLRLLEALSKLDPRQRDALILQKYHGWTLAQIAENLGCTTGAVAGLHARGLKKLHKHLTDMGISHA